MGGGECRVPSLESKRKDLLGRTRGATNRKKEIPGSRLNSTCVMSAASCDPIEAADLEALLSSTLSEAASLRAVRDPDEAPFRSRYTERELLRELQQQASANAAPLGLPTPPGGGGGGSTERARFIEAVAAARLGANLMDTEEGTAARPLLEGAVAVLVAGAGARDMDGAEALAIEALNRLGILAANREDQAASLALLQQALERYEPARRAVLARADALSAVGDVRRSRRQLSAGAGAESADREAAEEEAAAARVAADAAAVEEAHTLTCFYLAQAHGNDGAAAEGGGERGRVRVGEATTESTP